MRNSFGDLKSCHSTCNYLYKINTESRCSKLFRRIASNDGGVISLGQ